MNPLLRLPVLPADLKERLAQALAAGSRMTSSDLTEDELATFTTACEEVFANVVEHEFYCGHYSSNEQPKLKELLGAMAVSFRILEERIEIAKAAGETFDRLTIAAKFLHNLIAAANRCSHKGYPEILSYLTSRPMFYCSHSFTNLYMNNVINEAKAIMEHVLEAKSPVHSIPDVPTAEYTTTWNAEKVRQPKDIDYMWRPKLLGVVPWYFFASMCEVNHNHPGALPWYSFQTSDGVWNHHPFFNLVQSKHFPDTVLVDEQGCPFLAKKDYAKPIYYCRINTNQAWGVPSILAHFPKTPTDTSSSAEKGYFALFMLLLFHPWRHLQTDLLAPAFGSDELSLTPGKLCMPISRNGVLAKGHLKQRSSSSILTSTSRRLKQWRSLYLRRMALFLGSLSNVGLLVACQCCEP